MNPEFLWLYSNLEDIIDMEFIVTTKEEEKINDRDYCEGAMYTRLTISSLSGILSIPYRHEFSRRTQ